MKSLMFSVVLSCLGLLWLPQAIAERPLVAVLDFQEIETGLAAHEIELLADIARGEALARLGADYNIITRENLLDLLKAHGTNLEQCQGACETETGRLIGADFVVSGSIVRAFGSFKVNLKLHRTSPPELLGAEVRTSSSQANLEADVRVAMSAVLGKLSGDSSSRPADVRETQKAAPRKTAGGLAEATSSVLGALSPGNVLGGLLGAGANRAPGEVDMDASDSAPEPETKPEEDGGLHATVDLGGLMFFGPAILLEVGGKTRLSAWYRAVAFGLVASSELFIDPAEETYESAFGVGLGVRWYGRGHDGMDGLWYGLGGEYYSGDVFNDSSADYGGHYITQAVLAEGLVGYRWSSGSLAHQVGAGIGLGFELEFTQPEGGEEVFQRVYPVIVYEIELF